MTFLQCCGADLFRPLAALSIRRFAVVLPACCSQVEHQPAAIRMLCTGSVARYRRGFRQSGRDPAVTYPGGSPQFFNSFN
jgi:hypothetical protein